MTTLHVQNTLATAEISLIGGLVTAYQPHGQPPVLFCSQHAHYEIGRSVYGGIPVCWPWFGAHPTDPNKPNHGFVRTRLWQLQENQVLSDGSSQVTMAISHTSDTLALWPHPFQLQLIVTIGTQLTLEWVVQNPGSNPFTWTGALHTYFQVSDIHQITIEGLEGCEYLDKVNNFRRKQQQGVITFASYVDRVYLDTTADCLIHDPGFHRRIRIHKTGSYTTVVWNPWSENAAQMRDFGPQEYRQMVCIETANAANQQITVPPQGESRVTAVISLE